jgi:hypothetical protein
MMRLVFFIVFPPKVVMSFESGLFLTVVQFELERS